MEGFRSIRINREDVPRSIRRKTKIRFFAVLLILAVIGAFASKIAYDRVRANTEYTIELAEGLDRFGLSDKIGEELGWNEKEKKSFAAVLAQMQWAEFNKELGIVFSKKFNWRESEREIFLTNSTKYLEPEYDFLSSFYVPGSYKIKGDAKMAQIAGLLISRTKENAGENIEKYIEQSLQEGAANKTAEFVFRELELLPDLVPLPAKDLVIEKVGDDVLLRFSTIYFNQGDGPLELRADTATKGIRSDIERNVFQRIYKKDGSYRDKISGKFLWHQQHLHYHFSDFVLYDLEVVKAENAPDLSGVRSKSTFCIRDVSRVNMHLENRDEEARYLICGKEMQGISVGWGDTYFYSYVDQNLNITDLPSGIYKLTFIANPDNKFEESRTDNNRSSVTIEINMENLTVKVLKEEPEGLPSVEHIYEEQVFPD